MIVDGIVTDGILDVTFPDEDEPIAMIETLMNDTEAFDFYRVAVPSHSSATGITFFKNFITAEQKALLMAVTILLVSSLCKFFYARSWGRNEYRFLLRITWPSDLQAIIPISVK